MKHIDQFSWRIAIIVILLATAVVYAPMIKGKIPFPSDIFFGFPPFAKSAPAGYVVQHAEIGDLATSFYPYRSMAALTFREGALPLWNPYILSGAPFISMAQSALFYPPNFLFYFLPVPLAWASGFLLRTALAGLFAAMLLRRIGGTTTGAIVSGLLYAFCGFISGWQGQSMADGAIWLPLICYSLVRLHAELSPASLTLASFAFAMPVLAGHPETAAHLAIAGSLFAAFLVLMRPEANSHFPRLKFLGSFALSGLFALGIAAVQIFPTLEWLNNITHSLDIRWPPIPLWGILAFVTRDVVRVTNSARMFMPELAAYVGMLAFVAAPHAFWGELKKYAFFFLFLGALAICVVYGINPIFWLIYHTPVLGGLKNHRMILIGSFCFAVLAGLGVTVLEQAVASWPLRRRQRSAILALSGFIAAFAMIVMLQHRTTEVVQLMRRPDFALFLLIASAVPIFWKLAGGLKGRRFQFLLLGVLIFDLGTFSYKVIPFYRYRDVFPQSKLFDRIKSQSQEPFRIAQTNCAYGSNFQMMYGISAADGYEICLTRTKNFLEGYEEVESNGVNLSSQRILASRDRRLDMLNAKYIVVSEYDPLFPKFREQPDRFRYKFTYELTEVIENLNALPAAFIVPAAGVEVIPDEAGQLSRVKDPSFNPERSVILSKAQESASTGSSGQSLPLATKVKWISKRSSDFHLKVETGEPGILVISQIHYPGWKAKIDGREVDVLCANYALPAIPISGGVHEVSFSFEPASFKIGWRLSALAIAILIAINCAGFIKKRCIAIRSLRFKNSQAPDTIKPCAN
jgi:hypothetical protein